MLFRSDRGLQQLPFTRDALVDGDDNLVDVGVPAPASPAAIVGASSWSASTSMGTTMAASTSAPASSTANLIKLHDPLAFHPINPRWRLPRLEGFQRRHHIWGRGVH